MRINKSAAVIAALALLNLILGSALAYQHSRRPVIYADHIQQLRMDLQHQVLRVRLGSSEVPNGPSITNPEPSGSIALTPRAAIQLQVQLTNVIKLIQEAAKAQRVEQRSPEKSL
jgi:hypothetical protein